MLRIDARDFSALRGGGGEPFVQGVDGALLMHARAHGLADNVVQSNLARVNLRDGGVDAEVSQSVPGDETGFFDVPTAWQLKGTRYTDVRVGELLDGTYVRQKIRDGYGFRLALADSLTQELRDDWIDQLTTNVDAINPGAPRPLVVG